jgi:hypothetical protein
MNGSQSDYYWIYRRSGVARRVKKYCMETIDRSLNFTFFNCLRIPDPSLVLCYSGALYDSPFSL